MRRRLEAGVSVWTRGFGGLLSVQSSQKGSRKRMRPWEESPLIFPRRVGGIQPWEETARICSLAPYGIRRGSTDNHPPGISAFLAGEYPPQDSHELNCAHKAWGQLDSQ